MLKARLKQEYRHSSALLLNRIEFTKDTWTAIPKQKEEEARATLGDILEFDTAAPTEWRPLGSEEEAQAETSEEETEPEEETEGIEEAPKASSRRRSSRSKKDDAEE